MIVFNNQIITPIKDFDGYFISSDGKVYSNLGRGCRDRSKRTNLYEIKPRLCKNGYLRVYMRNNKTNKRVDRYVHRLVASHFICRYKYQNVVNHIDCDRTNNDVHNLEWTTGKGNNEYTMKLGRLKRDSKTGRYYSDSY